MPVTFYNSVQSFAQAGWNFILSGGKLVDQNTANLRAEICAGCHNNLPTAEIRKGGCSTCQKMGDLAIDGVRATIIKTKKTPHNPVLLACGLCGCDLKISVWMPNQTLLKLEDANAYPSFCWKKKIEENLEV